MDLLLHTHDLTATGQYRVPCEMCTNPAELCWHCPWKTGQRQGVSFFYYCRACWEPITTEHARAVMRYIQEG